MLDSEELPPPPADFAGTPTNPYDGPVAAHCFLPGGSRCPNGSSGTTPASPSSSSYPEIGATSEKPSAAADDSDVCAPPRSTSRSDSSLASPAKASPSPKRRVSFRPEPPEVFSFPPPSPPEDFAPWASDPSEVFAFGSPEEVSEALDELDAACQGSTDNIAEALVWDQEDRPEFLSPQRTEEEDAPRPPAASCPPTGQRESRLLLDLVYWRDPKMSGVAFAGAFLLLLCLANFSLISVVAYSGLLLLGATVAFRLYKQAMTTLGKASPEDNPLKKYLDKDLSIPDDRVHAQVDVCLQQAKSAGARLRSLVLVEEPVETVKFGVLLWSLTYIGAWFSGITLLTLALIAAFSMPKVYELYQPQIDEYWGLAAGHLNAVSQQVEAKLPFLKKKAA